MKETNEAKIRNLLTPIKNILGLVKYLKETNDENIFLALKHSNANDISEINCDRLIELGKKIDEKSEIDTFFKIQNEIKKIIDKIIGGITKHPLTGINDISRGRKTFKVNFRSWFWGDFVEYHIEIPFEVIKDKKLQKEFIEKCIKNF